MTVLGTDTWYHVAGTWDSTVGLAFYVNGVAEGSNPSQVSRSATGQPLRIGDQAFFGPRRFAGLIDDVKIFDRALTADEAAGLACISAADCGDANDDGSVSATDALVMLANAVSQPIECPARRCDTDSNGAISASDALRDLAFAVGQPVALTCPP